MNNTLKQNITAFIMATFSFFIICSNNFLKSYDVTSWLIYVLILIVFFKTDILGRKNRKESIIFSIILSIILVYGRLCFINIDNRIVSVLRETFKLDSLWNFICYFNILFVVFKNVFPKLYSLHILETGEKRISNKKLFILCALIIFIGWLPYFFSFYPGTLTPDSLSEYTSIYKGIHIISDHHPVLHALFIGLFYNLGMLIFHSKTAAIATTTVAQMVVLASVFSYSIVFLKQRNVKKSILVILTLCYALLPVNGYYSIVMWKDVLFAGCIILLTTEVIKLIEKNAQKKLTKKDVISFIVVSLVCAFFRNNAIYMYFLLSLTLIWLFKKYNKLIITVSTILVMVLYVVIKGPVFKLCGIQKTESSEYIGIPLQQIGRMAFKDAKFTKTDREAFKDLMPIEVMRDAYNPRSSDGIKFHSYYNMSEFDSNKSKYLKLYIKYVMKYPSLAIESYSISTLGFWYPGVEYWSVANGIWENEFGLKTKSLIKNESDSFIRQIEQRAFPVLSIEWSVGLYFWMLFIFFYIGIRKKGITALGVYMPCIGIWITMMLASPVFAEFRYIYCVVVTIPMLILYPYIEQKRFK